MALITQYEKWYESDEYFWGTKEAELCHESGNGKLPQNEMGHTGQEKIDKGRKGQDKCKRGTGMKQIPA